MPTQIVTPGQAQAAADQLGDAFVHQLTGGRGLGGATMAELVVLVELARAGGHVATSEESYLTGYLAARSDINIETADPATATIILAPGGPFTGQRYALTIRRIADVA